MSPKELLERERNWRLGRQDSRGIRSFTCKEVWETASVYKDNENYSMCYCQIGCERRKAGGFQWITV